MALSITSTPLLIGGEERLAADSFPVYDPSNGEVIGHAASASRADAEDAVRAAHEAWPAWAALTRAGAGAARPRCARRARERRRRARGDPRRENGKIRMEATIDPLVLAGRFHQAAAVAASLDDERIEGPPFTTTIAHVPAGVVTIIFPFNWPLAILGASLPYALIAGNTVVVKPPPDDAALRRADVAPHRAGAPTGRAQRGHRGRRRRRPGRRRRSAREARLLHRQRGRRQAHHGDGGVEPHERHARARRQRSRDRPRRRSVRRRGDRPHRRSDVHDVRTGLHGDQAPVRSRARGSTTSSPASRAFSSRPSSAAGSTRRDDGPAPHPAAARLRRRAVRRGARRPAPRCAESGDVRVRPGGRQLRPAGARPRTATRPADRVRRAVRADAARDPLRRRGRGDRARERHLVGPLLVRLVDATRSTR